MLNIKSTKNYYKIIKLENHENGPYKIFGDRNYKYFIVDDYLIIINVSKYPITRHFCRIIYEDFEQEEYICKKKENKDEEILNSFPEVISELERLKNMITIDIICNKFIINLANEFNEIFNRNNIDTNIYCINNLDEYKIEEDNYVLIFTPQHYFVTKNNINSLEEINSKCKCIYYNMEQMRSRLSVKNKEYNKQYFKLTNGLILNSLVTFDYNKDNYNYFNNIIYLPPPIITNNIQCEKIYDILLIGLVNNSTRRKPILDSLKRFFKIKIVYDKIGDELTEIINRSKVVLNLHYYNENTLLEEVRLNEIINSDTHILSELPHIDVDDMKEKYKDRVTFINIIEKPNKIIKKTDPIVVELKKLLKKPNKKYEHNFNNDLTEKILIENIRGSIEEYKKYNEYPHLFHKYLLKIKNPNTEITYNIEKENKYKNFYVKNFAHLHCYDISKFHEIYDEYLDKIDKYFNIIITYSIGEIKDIDYTIIKIPNKGMDVGAKFCMIKYLNDKKLEYDYVMFLHSKSCPKTRKKYFQIVEDLNDNFIKNIHDYDSYFPDIKWEIIDGRLKMLSGNPEYENSNLPERNLLYRNEILKYLNCDNNTNIFTEGNVYILKNTVINKLFTDKYLYNILNEPDDFDYNWITYRYGIKGDIKQVYDEFKLKKIKPRDEKSYDGYIEHVFERIVMNLCSNVKYDNDVDLINILIRTTYRPEYFKQCINSILSQSYTNYKIICCYDDKRCLNYLKEYEGIIEYFYVNEENNNSHKYNLYCNVLMDKVKDGWIMFLDDDDKLSNNNTLQSIKYELNNINQILFWQVNIAGNIIIPEDVEKIEKYKISTIGFCFHSNFKNLSRWIPYRCSDFYFVNELVSNYSFKRIKLNKTLTETQHNNLTGSHGEQNEYPFEEYIEYNNIKQIYVSESLKHFKDRIFKNYNLREYDNINEPSVFFGVYDQNDIKNINNHNGIKYIMFGGSDVDNYKYINNGNYLAISKCIKNRLLQQDKFSRLIYFNMIDKTIFKPVEIKGNKIFIYDGIRKKSDNRDIYGLDTVDEVVKNLPQYEYIYSSDLNLPNEKMPEVYAQCFIGLRLTPKDGNANTVQELEAMNIPVIHNQSEYGLKWENIQDIINWIKINSLNYLFNYSYSTILINSHSNLDITAGDTIMISNYMNYFMKNNNKILLITRSSTHNFEKNLQFNNYQLYKVQTDDDIINLIDNISDQVDILFIRNHNIINKFKDKSYLNKTIFYGLDIHIPYLKNLNNKYKSIITQSNKLKDLYINNGFDNKKINIIEPLCYKYNFNLPIKNNNQIRLIYCGTLRDEENILEIIEEFQKIHKERSEVVLTIAYGKIHGDIDFTNKVNNYIKNGVKGITFKHNLSHKEACYEIATSDIGICWRKNGWGDNGEVSTKVKEYEMYGLEIINNMKLKVGVVTSTNKLNKIDNIIRNFKQQFYFNKKLFLVLNNNDFDVNYIQKQMTEHNILYEIINLDEKFNLGHCLNEAIKKLKQQNYDIFAKFDDDDIYEKYYILEQVYNLNKYHNCIIGKYNVPLFIPEHNNFYTIDNFTKNNQFAEICRGSTITFNINNITHLFDVKQKQGVDSIFLKEHINRGGNIYVTSFNNYIWIKYLDNNKHTWNLDINDFDLKQIIDADLIYKLYSSLLEYTFIDVSHLLVTVIITMYNSSKTIEKCLLSMLDQSHKNIEIIVVDDESSDDSVERVTSFIEVHRNIKLIKNTENRGTYYCKNLALQSMSKNTKYIAFQDSDDYSHRERIRKQIEVLYLTNGKMSVSLCKRYNNLRFACVSQVYDIEIFNKLGYFDNSRFGADSEYLYRFFKLHNIKLTGNYNYNKGSIFNNNFSIHYCIPYKLYNINNNDDTCLSNLNPLNSEKRIKYRKKYENKINNLVNLYYDF